MPRDLGPKLGYFPQALTKGALVVLPVDDDGASDEQSTAFEAQILRFQYNPETITRTRSGEWKNRSDWRNRGARSQSEVQALSEQGSASLLARAETISLKLVFDATEGILAGRSGLAEDGVLPELAALELVTIGNESVESSGNRAPPERTRPVRPHELLLVLGAKRVFPVVLTNLTITEQRFSPALVPLRAECDVKLRVLEPFETKYNRRIEAVFSTMQANRETQRAKAIDAPAAGIAATLDQTAAQIAAAIEPDAPRSDS